jgi:hypothetical protein
MDSVNFNIHNLITIKFEGTNHRLLDHFRKDYSYFVTDRQIDPDIHVILSDFIPDNNDCYNINNKYYIKTNYIQSEDTYKMVHWKYCVKNIEEKPQLLFQGSLFSEIFLRDYFIEPLIAFKLAQKGLTFLHASSVAYNDGGFAFAACQGVGKTTTLVNLISDGATYLSNEPSLISHEGTIYSFPSFLHFYHYNLKGNQRFSKSLKKTERLELELKHLAHLLSFKYVSFPLNIDAARIYGKIGNKYPLKSQFILSKTTGSKVHVHENCDIKDIVKKLVLINRFELDYFSNRLKS